MSYWLYLGLATILFVAGLVMLLAPLALYLRDGAIGTGQSILAAAGGIQVVLILLLNPFRYVHGMMGDMSQIVILMEGYIAQVLLQLRAMDVGERASVVHTADRLHAATAETARLIQEYFDSSAGTLRMGRRAATVAPILGELGRLQSLSDEIGKLAGHLEGKGDATARTARGLQRTLQGTLRRASGKLPV